MIKNEELIGKTFNRWKIIGLSDFKIYNNGQKEEMVLCECQCKDRTIRSVAKKTCFEWRF